MRLLLLFCTVGALSIVCGCDDAQWVSAVTAASGETRAIERNPIAGEIRETTNGWNEVAPLSESVMPRGAPMQSVEAHLAEWGFVEVSGGRRAFLTDDLETELSQDAKIYESRNYEELPCNSSFVVVANFDGPGRLATAEGYQPQGACL